METSLVAQIVEMGKDSRLYYHLFASLLIGSLFVLTIGCKKSENAPAVPIDTTDTSSTSSDTSDAKYNPNIADDYSAISAFANSSQWGSYNLHDPSVIKYGSYYYIYSTDVAYGGTGNTGIMFRKSKDLVHWNFLGWIFNGTIPSLPLAFMQANQSGYKANGLWAPYIIKVNDQFRLYYSVPGNNSYRLACIALATSSYPEGPWTDQGIVTTFLSADTINAIDPAVIIDAKTGKHWMSYGSYETGIYIVELDPATGKRLHASDPGKRIAYRTQRHDAIEGSEILYNPELQKYFLFVSYDWLEDNYNVRVGRSDSPEGPYLDIHGNDMAAVGDNFPRITAQYQFKNHSGWQGVGHCGLLKDGANYFLISQARLGSNKYIMDLHVRRMVWTPDGWPVVSPERYAAIPQKTLTSVDLQGKWEQLELINTTSKNTSTYVYFLDNGTIQGIDNATWQFADNVLTLNLGSSTQTFQARVFNEWDWENSCSTLVFTGLSSEGVSIWGKKIKQ